MGLIELDFVHLDPCHARRQSPQSGFCVAIAPHILGILLRIPQGLLFQVV